MVEEKKLNSEIYALYNECVKFVEELVKKDSDGKSVNPDFLPKYYISSFMRNFEAQADIIEKTRQELVKKYGETQPSGEIKITTDENLKLFREDFDKLLEQEVEIKYSVIPLAVFNSVKADNFYPTLSKYIA